MYSQWNIRDRRILVGDLYQSNRGEIFTPVIPSLFNYEKITSVIIHRPNRSLNLTLVPCNFGRKKDGITN